MRNMIKYIFLCSLLLALNKHGFTQLSFEPLSVEYRNLEAMSRFKIANALTEEIRANVRMDLTVKGGEKVLTLEAFDIALKPGINFLNIQTAAAKLQFYHSEASNYLKLNDQLADGEYELCYTVRSKKGNVSELNYCTDFIVRNSSPLMLLSPFNGQSICEERPTLQWQNPMPLPADAKIRLVMAEVLAGQNETEAIYRNLPLLHLTDVGTNTLPMPSYVEQLKDGSTYAWQVVIYNESGILRKSEIWKFTKDCASPVKKNEDNDSYRQLKPQFDGTYYLAKEQIRFSFINSYSTEKLDYSIIDLETGSKIKFYPEINIHSGLNNIVIDADDCTGLKKGKIYMLKATNIHSTVLQMRFKYEG